MHDNWEELKPHENMELAQARMKTAVVWGVLGALREVPSASGDGFDVLEARYTTLHDGDAMLDPELHMEVLQYVHEEAVEYGWFDGLESGQAVSVVANIEVNGVDYVVHVLQVDFRTEYARPARLH